MSGGGHGEEAVILAELGSRGRLEDALSGSRRVMLRVVVSVARDGSQMFLMSRPWFTGGIPGRRVFPRIMCGLPCKTLATLVVAVQLGGRRNVYMASSVSKAIQEKDPRHWASIQRN